MTVNGSSLPSLQTDGPHTSLICNQHGMHDGTMALQADMRLSWHKPSMIQSRSFHACVLCTPAKNTRTTTDTAVEQHGGWTGSGVQPERTMLAGSSSPSMGRMGTRSCVSHCRMYQQNTNSGARITICATLMPAHQPNM